MTHADFQEVAQAFALMLLAPYALTFLIVVVLAPIMWVTGWRIR